MHEMSIAESIVKIALDCAAKENAVRINKLDLSIGTLAGIEFEALEFALEVVKKGSILERAEIVIDKVQAKAKCLECGTGYEAPQVFSKCPECGGYSTQLISGKEMQVRSLVID